MRLARLSDHVVLRHAQQLYNLIPHSAFPDHTQYRADEAYGQVASEHSVSFYEGHFRPFSGCRYGRAYSCRPCSHYDHVVMGVDFQLSLIPYSHSYFSIPCQIPFYSLAVQFYNAPLPFIIGR